MQITLLCKLSFVCCDLLRMRRNSSVRTERTFYTEQEGDRQEWYNNLKLIFYDFVNCNDDWMMMNLNSKNNFEAFKSYYEATLLLLSFKCITLMYIFKLSFAYLVNQKKLSQKIVVAYLRQLIYLISKFLCLCSQVSNQWWIKVSFLPWFVIITP